MIEDGEGLIDLWLFQDFAEQKCEVDCFYLRSNNQSPQQSVHPNYPDEQVEPQITHSSNISLLTNPSSNLLDDTRILRNRKTIKHIATYTSKQTSISKKKRKIKPSPYHNYQKHLIKAIKHILKPPKVTSYSSDIAKIEDLMWNTFCSNGNQTKKILYYVFNQRNQYEVSDHDLKQSGFGQIYHAYSKAEIFFAKRLMTQLALEQLTPQSIDAYLSTRRIRDQEKFKRYIQIFLGELQEGFIKKRFFNKMKETNSQIN